LLETATVDGLLVKELIGKLEASVRDRIIAISWQALIQGRIH